MGEVCGSLGPGCREGKGAWDPYTVSRERQRAAPATLAPSSEPGQRRLGHKV